MADLDDRIPALLAEEQNEKSPKHFTVDARTILQLGRQSIKDNVTAVLELVKNSYDADADIVEVEIATQQENGYIRIADNGCGMTEDVIDDSWLRIGFSDKRVERFSKRGRRKTGEKGVGRISADRLGSTLELRTRAENKGDFGLVIDWNLFDVEGVTLSDIPIETLTNVRAELPRHGTKLSSGTELIVRDLREPWTANEIRNLYDELSVLTPPFQQVQDFKIYLKTDVAPDYNGLITSSFEEAALIELEASFDGELLRYCLLDRTNNAAPVKQDVEVKWKQIVQSVTPGTEVRAHALVGPVRLKLMFYLRSQTDLLSKADFKLSDLREFLDRNAGVKIYRDNIRVRPYGDPATTEGDWLGLNERKARDPAGLSRGTYHFTANQVVGAVFLSRDDNSALIDSASREGLIHSEAFADMRALTLACLSLMEMHRHDTYQSKRHEKEQLSPDEVLTNFTKELSTLTEGLEQVQNELAGNIFGTSPEVTQALAQVARIANSAQFATESLNEIMSQAGVLRGLATLGIATSVFGHETQSALTQFVGSTAFARDLLQVEEPDIAATRKQVETALHSALQVRAWGAFSLERVKRNKREKRLINVRETVLRVAKELQPAFQAASIDLNWTRMEDVCASLFEMDVESIILNLLTNAYTACQQIQKIRRPRKVQIELSKVAYNNRDGFELVVSDTGPGVSDDLAGKIWKPLVSFKKNAKGNEEGTGLGLTIVNSIVTEAKGHKAVSLSSELGGALFSIWLPVE